MLKQQITARLELAFSLQGFAEPSVAQLKDASGVSLRTLYKYYPSKEAMIVGALAHRHQRYLDYLLLNVPTSPVDSVVHMFERLERWMEEFAPHGCLSISAIAAFPENLQITDAVHQHKQQVRELFAEQSGRADLATALFLLHEGVSSAWPVLGNTAVLSAQQTATQLLQVTK
ncbi:TetR/AcrR family transcriptional regulator [Ferrimonas lipolytica]|uniref:TetR/AcrR family transcriptional regulator n=1 Tax=Ferrimonas lipolytica TaxID=2724191 RepID=A0A6H1UD95_9GAMM|nr:TetR/AcrR family transcriptional regulator [Ferrimonas lipolytica]QIZ77077.1 TetR/AcrR family transcriptional regulator [Ferrimonas lipolytica]